MDKILRVNNISVRTAERQIVANITFDVGEGEVVLLSGANGSGKSTILNAIMCNNTHGKTINGSIAARGFDDVLSLNTDDLQRYRASVAYVTQRDEYAEMGNSIRIRDIVSSSNEAYTGKTLSNAEVNDLIDKWIPRQRDNKRIFDAKSKPAKFSGGEQRLLSVLSIVATRSDSGLIIIDEPLNNLDFVNARNISNLLNSVIRNNPKSAMLMITHCRIFPFITREIRLTTSGIKAVYERYLCHSCIGEPNEVGNYL
jgi:ABC-type multidrug transport system ATPase subunit